MKCTNCGKNVKQTEGKREKRFCDSTCRSGYWQKQKRESNKTLAQQYSEVIDKLIEQEPIKSDTFFIGHKAHDIATNFFKEQNRDLIIPKVKQLTPEVKVEFKPKTLAELKAKCPKGLDMLDRAKWIQDNRVKYGI